MVDRRDFLKGGAGLLGLGGLGAFLAWENQQDNRANDAVNRAQRKELETKQDRDSIELPEKDKVPVVGYNDPNSVGGFDQVRRTLDNQLRPSLEQSRSRAYEIGDVSEIDELLSSGSEARVGEDGVSGPRESFSTDSTGALPDDKEFVDDAQYILSKVEDTEITRQNDRGNGVRTTDFITFGATSGIQTNVAAKDVISEYDLVESDREAVDSALSAVRGINVFSRTDPEVDGKPDADPSALKEAKEDVARELNRLNAMYDDLTSGDSAYTTSVDISRDLGTSLNNARRRAERYNQEASVKEVDREFSVKEEGTAETLYDETSKVAQGYQELVNGIAGRIAQLDVIGRTLENGFEVAEEIQSNAGVHSADSYREALPGQNAEHGCNYAFDAVAEDLKEDKGVSPSEIEQAYFQSDSSLRVLTEEGNFTYDTC